MRWMIAAALAGSFATVPVPARPNGVRPPRTQWTFDVTCETPAGQQVVGNARVTGLEKSRKLSELRVRGDGGTDVPLPFSEIDVLTLGAIKGSYADATVKLRDAERSDRVSLRVNGSLGAVRLVAFGVSDHASNGLKVASCKRITVTRRTPTPGETSEDRAPAPSKK